MKNKRVVVHIGTMKTGSSSIQETLGFSREILLGHGVYYPDIIPHNHLQTFPPIFIDEPETYIPFRRKGIQSREEALKKCGELKKKWLREFERCNKDTFIISAENLSLPVFDRNAVSRMKEFLEDYFEEIVIVVYVRHYETLISSQVQQIVKNGFNKTDIQKTTRFFLNNPKSGLLYSNNIGKWVDAFSESRVIVRPFDPGVFRNGSLVDDFLFSLGIDAGEAELKEIRTNESIGKNAVAFLERFNQRYPVFDDAGRNSERGLASRRIPFDLFRKCGDEKFSLDIGFTEEQSKRLNDEIDYVNRFFKGGYAFGHVEASKGGVSYANADSIPVEFFIELVNNYNKRIENLLDRKDEKAVLKRDKSFAF